MNEQQAETREPWKITQERFQQYTQLKITMTEASELLAMMQTLRGMSEIRCPVPLDFYTLTIYSVLHKQALRVVGEETLEREMGPVISHMAASLLVENERLRQSMAVLSAECDSLRHQLGERQ